MPKRSKRDANDGIVAALRAEIELLREENAQLRLERQQPVTAAIGVARLTDLAGELPSIEGGLHGDAEWAALSEAIVLREVLVNACNEFERIAAAARRQLNDSTPAPELDRRSADRRVPDGAAVPRRRASDRFEQADLVASTMDDASPIGEVGLAPTEHARPHAVLLEH